MVEQAPLVLAFCADSFRTRQWLPQRGARLNFGNLIRWHVASFDAIILAQTTKALFYRQLDLSMQAAYEDATATMANNMMEGSALEGVQAFIDKRPPRW